MPDTPMNYPQMPEEKLKKLQHYYENGLSVEGIPKKVRKELARLHKIAPFRPYSVDAAGYKARFTSPVPLNRCVQIEKKQILSEGLEGYASEWTGDEQEGEYLRAKIFKEQGIRLWWD